MSKIIVQRFDYLKGAMDIGGGVNPFYGSAPIGNKTNITDDSFRYCVRIAKHDEDNVVRAEYAVTYKALGEVEKEKIVSKDFDFSPEGKDEAQKWLEEEYAKVNV
ncbi:MAG: hypothetical protein E7536_04060 [Ruminococcaceae bacterium]|nr:hypothetical protein [Oscillospiraceae bacterium]